MYHADCNFIVSEIKYQKYTKRILKEIAVLECETAKMFRARSHIHRFSQCQCFVGILSFVYNAIP